MARNRFTVGSEGEIALVAATAKTVLQVIAPANQMLDLKAFGVAFDATSGAAEPVRVQLLRQTTAGTVTAVTPRKTRVGGPGVQATAGKNATVEPTDGDILREYEVHPQTGYERAFEPGEIEIDGGGRLALKITAPAAVNCIAWMDVEE